ncbi:hypothetical protein [Nocardia sp. NBC_00511]|uniref:hypothetical protein n=1 Tax=Nocardia sp. NBC_00511 TaxID=2903591 RepID=UPI0030E09AB9
MNAIGDRFTGVALDRFADEAEHLQLAITTRTVTTATPDGTISVEVSADGHVHRWQVPGTIDTDASTLVATVIGLIEEARTAAQHSLHDEIDAITGNGEVRAVRDAVRDVLASAPSRSLPDARTAVTDEEDEPFHASSIRAPDW